MGTFDLDKVARRLTGIEAITILIWLALALAGHRLLAGVVLIVGIGVEEQKRFRTLTSKDPPGLLAVPVLVEVVGWILSLVALARYGLAGAAVALFVTLWLEHSLVGNLTAGRGLLWNIFNVKALGFSAVEAVGGAVAVTLIAAAFATGNLLAYMGAVVGTAVLLYTSTAEHREGMRVAIADGIAR